MTSDIQSTAQNGRRVVADALRDRGAEVHKLRQGNVHILQVRTPASGECSHVRVRARTSGTWQGDIRDGDPARAPSYARTFWVFVDLEDAGRPLFFVVPDAWMRQDIQREHQVYLDRHGGERAITRDSTHHAIQSWRVQQWRDRWDLLGLLDEPMVTQGSVIDDVRVAEEQIARGEGVEHDEARRGIIARLRKRIHAGRGSR
jgi:hypothetical protein